MVVVKFVIAGAGLSRFVARARGKNHLSKRSCLGVISFYLLVLGGVMNCFKMVVDKLGHGLDIKERLLQW
ncbi:MAG: hypothetical protein KatS3mg110_0318 [Pirellulaceae bacterium]|nr:MAG: hypothetical protein KatS3mg110_0318 [Pirellulaceae bacterium]